jgi:hypothetical protein
MTPQFIGLFRTLPRVVVFCAFFFFSLAENLYSQCAWYSTNVACTTPAPTVVGNSIACSPIANNGGRRNFRVTGMVAGCTYRISNCGSGFDTQMTIFDAIGNPVAFNDNNGPDCAGTEASIDFTCPADGTYNIQLNRSPCATINNLNGVITVTLMNCVPVAPGFNMTNGTQVLTCGTTYNFYDSGGQAVNYTNNQSLVETFTSGTPGECVSVTFTSFVSENGFDELIIHDGASMGDGVIATLTGSVAGLPITFTSSSGSLTFEWGSDGSSVFAGWQATLECSTNCGTPPPPCSNCANATVISSLPFSGNYTTCGACDDVSDGDGCVSGYLGGEDYMFTYTPPNTGPVNISLSGTLTWTGVSVISGCPTAGGICVATTGDFAGNPSIFNLILNAGEIYYIIVDTNPSPDCTPFTIDIQEYIIDPNSYIIGNSNVSTCSGTFYDSGGLFGEYQDNEFYTYTICSSSSGDCIKLDFLTFQTESGLDVLSVYDGPNTLSPLLGTYSGSTLPPSLISTSGCLTFVFDSDGSVTYPGWSAAISCISCGGGPCAQTCTGGPAPVNDACSGAQSIGTLPTPAPCPSGSGAPITINGTNLCATAETPYSSLLGCQPTGDMAAPAADVWYTFTITAPILQIQIYGLSQPNVGLYEGTNCLNMIPRGCAIGNAGILNTNFQGLAPGQYFLQVSGGSLVDQCDFDLVLRNHFDCQGCVIQSDLTVTPPPSNGEYEAGETVTFCYTITNYNQTSANWLHGVVPVFGNGWDLSTLSTVPAVSCSGSGTWSWYNSAITSTATGQNYGPGFFYETSAGSSSGVVDANPGNNFGDSNGSNLCDWTFCWTISTLPEGACLQGANLNVGVNTLGDGESGSWTSLACTQDPVTTSFAQLNCCPAPIVNVTQPLCTGQSNGSAVAQGQGTAPWDYVWRNSAGVIIQTNLGVSGSATLSGLAAGSYLVETTDGAGCVASELFQIIDPPGSVVSISPSGPSLCLGTPVTFTASGAATYTWSPAFGLSSTTGASVSANPTTTTTYTVTGISGSCTDTETVTVTVSLPVNAGNNGSVTVCATGTPVNLFSYLGSGANNIGTWSGPSTLLGGYAGTYNPVTMNPGVYTYTVVAAAPCANATATVTVTETTTGSPGTNGAVVVCSSGGNINLFSSLGGAPSTTGTWSGPSGLIGGYLGTFNPLINTPGTYTYTVPGTSPCPPLSATVAVSIVSGPTATINYPSSPFCSNDSDSNPTITGTAGGMFSASPVGLSINNATGAIQPTLSLAGTYTITYTILASGGCPVFTTTTTVQVLEPLQIYVTGTNPTCATSCDGSADALVTGGLPPYSYTWSGSGSTSATASGLCEGTHTAIVTDAAGCVTLCTPVVPAGCFQIQSILVDACGLGAEEGLNEMVFLQVGSSPLATSGLSVNWATANTWQGLCTNPTFIANVNATITGGGSLIAAPATLPAGANVVLITSSTTLSSTNLFTNLTGPLYVLFQCGSQTSGNFTNSSGSPGLKTLTMTFNGGCADQVSYLPGSLTTNVNTGANGASVVYTSGGVPTYVNYGCSVPSSIQNCDVVLIAPPFDVVVSPATSSICEGSTVVLNATGADTYTWSPSTTLSASSGASVTATPTVTTVYAVTGTSGPCSETESVTVNVEATPTATVVYNGSPFCSDITSIQTPVVSGSTGGTFSAAPAGLTLNTSTGAINPSTSAPGTYTVTYMIPASGSCPASSTTTTLTITLAPAVPTLTPTNPCSGLGVVFTAGNGSMFEFFINGISQGPASPTTTFTSGTLNGGDQVCVRSTPPVPFVMNGNINEPEWGSPLANSSGGPATSGFGMDNRIDALYLRNINGQLYGAVAGNEHDGNDQANNNWILLFIDSKPGGYNNLSSWTNRSNVPLSTNGLLNLALAQNVIFDAGFTPDYILCMNQAASTAYFDLYDMQANVNTYLGNSIANPSKFGFIGNSGTGDYTHGFEFTFPLSQIGSPTTSIQAFAMMVNDPNSGIQTFLSNQFLTSAGVSEGNYGDGFIDFNNAEPDPISFLLSADCFEETCVTVTTTVTPTFNPIPPICYEDTAPVLPTTSTNGISGTWSPAVSNTASGVYTFTPTISQCTNSTTLSITVYPETLTTPIYHD